MPRWNSSCTLSLRLRACPAQLVLSWRPNSVFIRTGEADRLLGNKYDELKLGISFRMPAGHIVMQFSDHVEWVRMTSGGARKLAAMLTEKATELDRLGNASTAGGKRVRPKPADSIPSI